MKIRKVRYPAPLYSLSVLPSPPPEGVNQVRIGQPLWPTVELTKSNRCVTLYIPETDLLRPQPFVGFGRGSPH